MTSQDLNAFFQSFLVNEDMRKMGAGCITHSQQALMASLKQELIQQAGLGHMALTTFSIVHKIRSKIEEIGDFSDQTLETMSILLTGNVLEKLKLTYDLDEPEKWEFNKVVSFKMTFQRIDNDSEEDEIEVVDKDDVSEDELLKILQSDQKFPTIEFDVNCFEAAGVLAYFTKREQETNPDELTYELFVKQLQSTVRKIRQLYFMTLYLGSIDVNHAIKYSNTKDLDLELIEELSEKETFKFDLLKLLNETVEECPLPFICKSSILYSELVYKMQDEKAQEDQEKQNNPRNLLFQAAKMMELASQHKNDDEGYVFYDAIPELNECTIFNSKSLSVFPVNDLLDHLIGIDDTNSGTNAILDTVEYVKKIESLLADNSEQFFKLYLGRNSITEEQKQQIEKISENARISHLSIFLPTKNVCNLAEVFPAKCVEEENLKHVLKMFKSLGYEYNKVLNAVYKTI